MSSDDDTLITKRGRTTQLPELSPNSQGGLPVGMPGEEHSSLEDKRAELVAKIEEISGVLRYMGTGHPRRQETASRLERMQKMLEQMNQAIRG